MVILYLGQTNFFFQSDEYWSSSLELLVYPLIVTSIMAIVPVVFEAIGRFEKYKNARHELYSTLIRVTLLQMTIMVVLASFWYYNSPSLSETFQNDDIEEDALNSTLVRIVNIW